MQELDTASDLPEEHRRFLLRGSSLGGARPKATTAMDGKQWIAKFSRSGDHFPICRAEYATMMLASKVGLNVPPVRLKKVMEQDIYLIERFDRLSSGRIPFISGLTITGAHETESTRQSYRNLADQLRLFGSKSKEDTRELWKRMVFNILCNNTDDHLRNHGFLWDGKGWRLSPAYDIVPLPEVGTERILALGVGQEGRRATLRNALSDATGFGLTKAEAVAIASAMQKNVKAGWKKLFQKCGLSSVEIERLAVCFIACDEAIENNA